MQQLNLNTTSGLFQKTWSQAFNDYSAAGPGHWHKAAQELQQIATTYPQFKGVNRYLTYAQQQAQTEKVSPAPTVTPTPSPSASSSFLADNWPLLVGGAVVVLGILLFGVLIVRRRGAKPAWVASKQNYGTPANGANPSYPYMPPPVNQGSALPQTPPYQSQLQPRNPSMPFGAPPIPQAPVWPAPSAPPQPFQPPVSRQPGAYNAGTSNAAGDRTQIMTHWPCGHMNLSTARFCSKCGEPAQPNPPPPMGRYEQ